MTEEILLKEQISPPRNVLQASFQRLESKLAFELDLLSKEKSNVIPVVAFSKISFNNGRIPPSTAKQIAKRGCVIVRNVIPREEAEEILKELKEYMVENGEDPNEEGTTFYEIYWSKAQVLITRNLMR